MLERMFDLAGHRTSVPREFLAGATTFMTMSYIIVVQPALFSSAGIDFGAVLMATCLSAALASLLMGLWANYPIALAPGMGENFFFIYSIVLGLGVAWQKALGMVFLSGVLFILLALFRVREALLDSIPQPLRLAISGGIGAFILFIGLGHAGVLVRDQQAWARLVSPEGLSALFHGGSASAALDLFRVYRLFPDLEPAHLVALVGLAASLLLMALRLNGALLAGMLAAGVTAAGLGLIHWRGLIAAPPDIGPTFLELDLSGLFNWKLFPLVLVFLFMDLFDTVGTLIGVGEQAGLIGPDGRLPRARRALLADAVGTVIGAALGTSTVTSYIESAAGVQAGGRTGLTAVVCAGFFLAATFFSPLVQTVGSGVTSASGIVLFPVTAAALIVVGAMMLRSLARLRWKDWPTSVPAALVVLGMPLSYSIADGLALGFIAYPLLHVLAGRGRQAGRLSYLLGAVFVLRYAFL